MHATMIGLIHCNLAISHEDKNHYAVDRSDCSVLRKFKISFSAVHILYIQLPLLTHSVLWCPTQIPRHTDTQTHRHTHRHTDTHTHTHTHLLRERKGEGERTMNNGNIIFLIWETEVLLKHPEME